MKTNAHLLECMSEMYLFRTNDVEEIITHFMLVTPPPLRKSSGFWNGEKFGKAYKPTPTKKIRRPAC